VQENLPFSFSFYIIIASTFFPCTQRIIYLPEQASYLVCDLSALFAYGQNDLPGRTTIAFPDTGLATPCILQAWAKKFNVESFEKSFEVKRHDFIFDEWFHPEHGYHSHSKRPANRRSQP
jgi:hypothetical protein